MIFTYGHVPMQSPALAKNAQLVLQTAMYSAYPCLSRQQSALQFSSCRRVRAPSLAVSSLSALMVDPGSQALGMETALACARTVRTAVVKRTKFMLLVVG